MVFTGCLLLTFLYEGSSVRMLRVSLLQEDRDIGQAPVCVSDVRLSMRNVIFRYMADGFLRHMWLLGVGAYKIFLTRALFLLAR